MSVRVPVFLERILWVVAVLFAFAMGTRLGVLYLQPDEPQQANSGPGFHPPGNPGGPTLESPSLDWLTGCFLGSSAKLEGALLVPEDFKTIQAAIDAAPAHGIVLVSPGRYRENLNFTCKPVVVLGAKGARETVIDGGRNGAVARFVGAVGSTCAGQETRVVLSGFTLTGGAWPSSGHEHSRLKVGGGLYILGTGPAITWNIIEGNEGGDGGGILCDEGGDALIANNLIRQNRATKGGGIRVRSAHPMIVNNLIQGNRADEDGGGLYWLESSSPFLSNNTIIENVAENKGGGLFASGGPPQPGKSGLVNNIFANNKAKEGEELAVVLFGTRIIIDHNLITGSPETSVAIEPEGALILDRSNVFAALRTDEVLPPTKGTPLGGRGEPGGIIGHKYDLLGQPRLREDGGEGSLDIGAIQISEEPLARSPWGALSDSTDGD